MAVPNSSCPPNAGMEVRRARVERSIADMSMPMGEPIEGEDGDGASRLDGTAVARRGDAERHVAGWSATRRTDAASRRAARTACDPAARATANAGPVCFAADSGDADQYPRAGDLPAARSGALPQLVAAGSSLRVMRLSLRPGRSPSRSIRPSRRIAGSRSRSPRSARCCRSRVCTARAGTKWSSRAC